MRMSKQRGGPKMITKPGKERLLLQLAELAALASKKGLLLLHGHGREMQNKASVLTEKVAE